MCVCARVRKNETRVRADAHPTRESAPCLQQHSCVRVYEREKEGGVRMEEKEEEEEHGGGLEKS